MREKTHLNVLGNVSVISSDHPKCPRVEDLLVTFVEKHQLKIIDFQN